MNVKVPEDSVVEVGWHIYIASHEMATQDKNSHPKIALNPASNEGDVNAFELDLMAAKSSSEPVGETACIPQA